MRLLINSTSENLYKLPHFASSTIRQKNGVLVLGFKAVFSQSLFNEKEKVCSTSNWILTRKKRPVTDLAENSQKGQKVGGGGLL